MSLIEISNNCLNLKTLNIRGCSKLTIVGVNLIEKKCLKLENIEISFNENITDLSLIEISKHCLNLKILNIERYSKDGLIAIVKKCFEWIRKYYFY